VGVSPGRVSVQPPLATARAHDVCRRQRPCESQAAHGEPRAEQRESLFLNRAHMRCITSCGVGCPSHLSARAEIATTALLRSDAGTAHPHIAAKRSAAMSAESGVRVRCRNGLTRRTETAASPSLSMRGPHRRAISQGSLQIERREREAHVYTRESLASHQHGALHE